MKFTDLKAIIEQASQRLTEKFNDETQLSRLRLQVKCRIDVPGVRGTHEFDFSGTRDNFWWDLPENLEELARFLGNALQQFEASSSTELEKGLQLLKNIFTLFVPHPLLEYCLN